MGLSFTRDVFRYYSLVPGGGRASRITSLTGPSLTHILAAILMLLLVATSGFFAGRLSLTDLDQRVIQLTTKPEIFSYNRTFGEAPSKVSDSAWFSLFPEQGGFFRHPTIAPKRSAFSVFHQLHCLDGIRTGYWAIHAAVMEGRQIADEELPFMSSPPHIRHCIDLIRQSLMCRPDLTVELKEEELGGVRGFGTEHQCHNWDELIAWVSKWESYKQEHSSKDKHTSNHGDHA